MHHGSGRSISESNKFCRPGLIAARTQNPGRRNWSNRAQFAVASTLAGSREGLRVAWQLRSCFCPMTMKSQLVTCFNVTTFLKMCILEAKKGSRRSSTWFVSGNRRGAKRTLFWLLPMSVNNQRRPSSTVIGKKGLATSRVCGKREAVDESVCS